MFKKSNLTEDLYKEKKYLFLKANIDSCNFVCSQDIEYSLMKIIREYNPIKVILDLDQVFRIKSSTIGAFISIQSELRKMDGELFLMNPTYHIQKIFNLIGVNDLFNIIQSLDEI